MLDRARDLVFDKRPRPRSTGVVARHGEGRLDELIRGVVTELPVSNEAADLVGAGIERDLLPAIRGALDIGADGSERG